MGGFFGGTRDPNAHAASHAAGTKASYNGQVAGMSTNVFIRANNVGTAGNSITLTFDGVDDIDTFLAAWNAANTSNTAELVLGDGTQVPDDLEEITLSGGTAGGSDPFKNINQDLGTTDRPTFDGLVVARNNPSATLVNSVHVSNFVAQDNTNQAPLVAIGGTGNIEVYKDSEVSKALAYGFAEPGQTATDNYIVSLYSGSEWNKRLQIEQNGTASVFGNLVVRDNTGNETATFDAQAKLTANRTYDLPDASGTIALTSHWSGSTTNNTPTILNLDGTATNRFTIAANTAAMVDLNIIARRTDTVDKWFSSRRTVAIRRNNANGTAIIGSVQTIGVDQAEGSPTWSVAITADDTNEALQVEVTGATSETVSWRVMAFYQVV